MAKNSIFGKKFHFWLKIDENPFFFEHENLTFAEKICSKSKAI